jgi:hypothetical protein
MIPPDPALKIDIAEKLTRSKIAATHAIIPNPVEPSESSADKSGERLFQQPVRGPSKTRHRSSY